ncbi:hypothetical protein [Rhodococcus sp. UNC363MFTsu5.1]|uniref:hypothetical protein n=1 Tax=Rhodococcus sp. UNC363MFTsu5.1 TaxID=1449069 RepID=UPI0004871DE4|nr:hypothetical protein [Rhodococcus sp. UNC363MFTsu5.1]
MADFVTECAEALYAAVKDSLPGMVSVIAGEDLRMGMVEDGINYMVRHTAKLGLCLPADIRSMVVEYLDEWDVRFEDDIRFYLEQIPICA